MHCARPPTGSSNGGAKRRRHLHSRSSSTGPGLDEIEFISTLFSQAFEDRHFERFELIKAINLNCHGGSVNRPYRCRPDYSSLI